MIRLALCGDEAQCLENTTKMINGWLEARHIDAQMKRFNNRDALIKIEEKTP